MATTINAIIKETLDIIKAEHLSLTPDTYAKLFCKVAKRRGVIVEECQKLDKYLQKLDPKIIEEIKRLPIASVEDLLSFCIVRLNRTHETDGAKMTQSLIILSKRLLQSITLLHDAKATQLANASLERLDFHQNLTSIELMKEKWFDFITQYDDSYLRQLEPYGITHKEDLEGLVKAFLKFLSRDTTKEIYAAIAPLFITSLEPSITTELNDELHKFAYELHHYPEALDTKTTQKELREFILKRIQYDKNEVTNDVQALNKLLEQTHEKITHLVYNTHFSHEQIQGIHADLEAVNALHTDDIRTKLLAITSSLEEKMSALNHHVINDQAMITQLQKRVSKLELALLEARQDARRDTLTHVATKRALMDELSRAEEAFNGYHLGYCLCLVSIDCFKMLYHTYGQEASSIVLTTIGDVLRQQIKKSDFVGRFGDDTFLVILPSYALKEALFFAKKLSAMIEQSKFLYKNERIAITISGIVAQRLDYASQGEMLQAIEQLLIEANSLGDNQVLPQ